MAQSFDPFPGLRPIGYWKDHDEPDLPDPAHLVDHAWDARERALVAPALPRPLCTSSTAIRRCRSGVGLRSGCERLKPGCNAVADLVGAVLLGEVSSDNVDLGLVRPLPGNLEELSIEGVAF